MPGLAAQLACDAVLSQFGGTTVHLPSIDKRAPRIRAAENMLRQSPPMAPADVAQVLRVRYAVSLRTAQRYAKAAATNVRKI
jgi:hypothetical protein